MRARVAMRLEQHQNAAVHTQSRGIESRANFGGMMTVVVDDGNSAFLASHLKATVHTDECGQTFADLLRRNFQLRGYAHRGQRIQNVVLAGHAQLKTSQIGSTEAHAKVTLEFSTAYILGLEVGLRAAAISDHPPLDERKNALHVLIRQAGNDRAVERNLVEKLDERGADV